MSSETQKVDVLAVLAATDDHLQTMQHYGHSHDLRGAMAVVAELIEAARNASAVISHAYHTALVGDLAEDAHDAYQQLDAALGLIEVGKADSAGDAADYKSNASLRAQVSHLKNSLERRTEEIEATKRLLEPHFKNVSPMPGDWMIGVNRSITLYGYAVDVVNQLKNARGGK